MEIVCVLGSPRTNGNSTALARRFCETAESRGARVRTFALNKLKYRGCQGCMGCKNESEKCILEDDLTQVLDAVYEADVLVMASPVYYGDVSSQMKGFIDRTFSFLVSDYTVNTNMSRLKLGKKLVFILTQAEPDENDHDDIFPKYAHFFEWYGFMESSLIRACGVMDAGEVEKRRDVMDLAGKTAEELCS
jgi:multimeric flavodoxin WrbA